MKTAAAVAIGSSPVLTFGALQLLGTSQPTQWATITTDFLDLHFWFTLWVMMMCGSFGGIAYELLLRGGAIEMPHRVRETDPGRSSRHAPADSLIALGIVGRAIVGAAAAATVVLVIAPSTAQSAIALGVTAGAAAPALIRLMRKQLLFAADAMARLQRESKQPAAQPAPAAEPTALTQRPAVAAA
jgi:hypothetical protein